MRAETSFLSLKCGTEVTAALNISLFFFFFAASAAAGAAVGHRCAELAAPLRCTPGVQRQPNPVLDEKCLSCQLWFPAWPLLPDRPSRPRRARPFVCGPCSPWTRRSLAFSHATVSNHPAHPPLNPEPPSPSSNQLLTLGEKTEMKNRIICIKKMGRNGRKH